MSRLRAVETGRSIARPAYSGVSALILPTGELLPGALEVGPVDPRRAPVPEEPARMLRGRLPRRHGLTPYARFGDLFAAQVLEHVEEQSGNISRLCVVHSEPVELPDFLGDLAGVYAGETMVARFGPVVGTHIGPGALGVTYLVA